MVTPWTQRESIIRRVKEAWASGKKGILFSRREQIPETAWSGVPMGWKRMLPWEMNRCFQESKRWPPLPATVNKIKKIPVPVKGAWTH